MAAVDFDHLSYIILITNLRLNYKTIIKDRYFWGKWQPYILTCYECVLYTGHLVSSFFLPT